MRVSVKEFREGAEVEVEVVSCQQVAIGDIALAWTTVKSRPTSWFGRLCAEAPYVVVEIDKAGAIWAMNKRDEKRALALVSSGDWMFVVREPRIDGRFPHRCGRCGKEAYVGLNRVEHRLSEGCPAR